MSFHVPSFRRLVVSSIGSVILCRFQHSERDNFKSFLFNSILNENQFSSTKLKRGKTTDSDKKAED